MSEVQMKNEQFLNLQPSVIMGILLILVGMMLHATWSRLAKSAKRLKGINHTLVVYCEQSLHSRFGI